VTFTVRDLVNIPSLKTRVVAGGAGDRRAIAWAHSCELAAPWEWLGRGDLLMTNGFTVPSGAPEQVEFVRQLDATGIAAVAIGDKLHAPKLSADMLAEADRRGFPILSTAYDVPFIAVAQAVAQGSRHAEQGRLTLIMRIYEAVRAGARSEPREIVRRIGSDLAASLHIVDRLANPLLAVPPLDEDLREQVVAAIEGRDGSLPAVVRVADGERRTLIVPVPTSEFACLVARPRGETDPPLAVLQHAAAVVAIEIEREIAQDETRRRLGSELLAHLIDRRIDPESGNLRLADFRLAGTELVMLAIEATGESCLDRLHRELRRAGLANIRLRRVDILYVLVAGDVALDLQAMLAEHLTAGSSAPISTIGQIPDAAREARWALEAGRERHRQLTTYGGEAPRFMPRTVSEARSAADEVLGGLLAYDAEHAAELVRSLRQFLSDNRSWQRAAAAVGVHKQTLVYRMRRVEELTGRRLDDTADVAELWLALKAHDLLTPAEQPMRQRAPRPDPAAVR